MKETGKAIANIIIAGLLLLNAILTASGKNPLPFDEYAITGALSYLAAAVDTVYVWWKNQNVTLEAQTGQKIIDEMKSNRDEAGGESDPLQVE